MGWAANPEGPEDTNKGYTLSDAGATATLNTDATFDQLKAAIAVEGVTKVIITGEITSSTELEITKEGLELVGEEGAKLDFTDAKSIVVKATDVVLTNLNVTSTSIAVKINEGKTGTRINGGTYICSTPDAEGAGVIYFLGQNGDIYVSGATLTGKLGMYNVTGKLDGITGNTIKYTSTSSTPVVGISALFNSALTAGVISPVELAAQNKITMPANGAQYPVLYESSAWKGLDGLAYADTKDNLAALVGSGVKENVLIKLKANTKYSFTESLTIQQEGVRLEGADGAKLEFVGAGIVVDANNVAVNNLNIETSQGATITINENKTGFVLTNGTYSCSTLAGGEIEKQGESCLRFKGSNGAINVSGATLIGGIYIGSCNGSLDGIKDNSISYTYEGPTPFVGISATFGSDDASAASIKAAALAAQNTIKMPATGMQYDVAFENNTSNPWKKFECIVTGVPAIKDNKINLTAGSDVAYNGVVLQRALDYAATLDTKPEIILAAGTYQGSFVMADGVNVTGAVDGNGKPASILNGGGKGRVVSYKADAKYNGSATSATTPLANETTWSNLAITNGKTNDGGAGAYICANVTLKNCVITKNVAGEEATASKAGGVLCDFGGTLDGCIVSNNTVYGSGAGIQLNTNGSVLNCEVFGNTAIGATAAVAHSGGIGTRCKAEGAAMLIRNSLIYNNKANSAAAVTVNAGTTMVNTLVYGNEMTGEGGEAAVSFGNNDKAAAMLNCTVWGNTAPAGVEGNVSITDAEGSNQTITNCIMETIGTLSKGTFTYNASKTEITGTGNVTLTASPFEADSYELAAKINDAANPCINGGLNTAYSTETYPKVDLAGKTRVQGKSNGQDAPTIDMGAFEFVKSEIIEGADGLEEALGEAQSEIILTGDIDLGSKALTVSSDAVIKAPEGAKEPVVITVAEGQTAFTTSGTANLTLENIKIVAPADATVGTKAIVVATGTSVKLEDAHVENAPIEVTGTLELANSGFKATTEKAALDVQANGIVTIEGVEFVGKAITAVSGGSITLNGCKFVNQLTKASTVATLTNVITAGSATTVIDRCTFANIVGDGAIISGSAVTVSNCLFYNNGNMKLMDVANSSTASVINNTFVNTTANNAEPVITIAATPTSVTIKNNILWTVANEAIVNNASSDVTISHNALKTAATSVDNNNLILPTYDYIKFSNAGNNPYELLAESPIAKAQGDITAVADGATDILGNPRLTDDKTNKTVHLGAYESVYTPSTGGGSAGGGTGDETPNATGIKLDKTTLTLPRLQSYTLVATVEPAAAGGVKWTSTDPAVATVDANGKVTAVKVGQTTIIATAINGGLTALCQVTVDFATGVEEALAESAIFGREGGILIQPATPVEMIIVNMAGAIVVHRTISQAETISVPKGIYIVRLNSGDHVLTQKVNVR